MKKIKASDAVECALILLVIVMGLVGIVLAALDGMTSGPPRPH